MKLTLPAPAKLNLFLHITGRKENGYHNLQTLFQMLDYGDHLEIESNNTGKIELSSNEKKYSKQREPNPTSSKSFTELFDM